MERSADGVRFETVSRIAPTAGRHYYELADPETADGRRFYCLALRLRSGQTTFSNIVTLAVHREGDARISPVPVSDRLNIHLSSGAPAITQCWAWMAVQ